MSLDYECLKIKRIVFYLSSLWCNCFWWVNDLNQEKLLFFNNLWIIDVIKIIVNFHKIDTWIKWWDIQYIKGSSTIKYFYQLTSRVVDFNFCNVVFCFYIYYSISWIWIYWNTYTFNIYNWEYGIFKNSNMTGVLSIFIIKRSPNCNYRSIST